MSVQLFEHNQRAYLALERMLEKSGKAAVIHPTGTGKSYIAFKLLEQHPAETFLWLSPSDYIVKTQLASLRMTEPEMDLDHVTFLTYAKLMQMARDQVRQLAPQYIILDEFHRCGAQRWGEGVRRLLVDFPGAKLVGLSATNIRYLDNQRDIAQELFDGCIASQMTLGEAIVRGILPKPLYVTTVFRYQQALEQYQQRIWAQPVALRQKNQEYYDALRRALEKAEGLDVIFKKYIRRPQGKYLLFCSDYDHLQQMRAMTAPWFRQINPQVHTYVAYSSDPETSRAFRDFQQDNSPALKLLLCIDMLNEGIHVKGIAGVILFRPTISPIVYKQQIGRALTSGDSNTPLILDVVNNFEGLYAISAIQKEMDEAVLALRQNGEGDRIQVERFQIEEQVPDCTQLFARLQESLSLPWNHYFQAAKAYFRENGNLDIPKHYDTPEGLHLGQWLVTQRSLYHNSRYRLSQEQIGQLESIGMQWQRYEDRRWQINYQAARAFYEAHGHLRVASRYVTEDGIGLGNWIGNVRRRYGMPESAGGLSQEQVEAMDQIGMVWDNAQAQWQHHFGWAADYFDRHGDLDVPAAYVTEDGFALGRWLPQLRSSRNLTQGQIEQLNAIGMRWQKRTDSVWMQGYAHARDYYEATGGWDMPSDYQTEDGFALGKWVSRQQYAYQNPGKSNCLMTEQRIALLRQIHFPLEKVDPWEYRYQLAQEYATVHGDLHVPANYKTADGLWLGKWLYLQRKELEKEPEETKLTPQQREKLERLGIA